MKSSSEVKRVLTDITSLKEQNKSDRDSGYFEFKSKDVSALCRTYSCSRPGNMAKNCFDTTRDGIT
jgi:hypothetical protein